MSDLGYSSYKPPRGPETPEDMEWVADCITRQLKARRDFDKAIQDGDYIKVKIEQSRMYNQELVSAETVSGPKVSDGDVAEIFVVLDEMLEDDTILLLARRQ